MPFSLPAAPAKPSLGDRATFEARTDGIISWFVDVANTLNGLNGYMMGAPTVLRVAESGTYSKPASAVALMIEVLGGGGGGGGASFTGGFGRAAPGGSSGAYIKCLIENPASSISYTVGAAGAGGPAGNNSGSNGGTTTIAGIVAPGGTGAPSAGTAIGDRVISARTTQNVVATSQGTLIARSRGASGEQGIKIDAQVRTSGSGGSLPMFGNGADGDTVGSSTNLSNGSTATGNGCGGAGGISSDTVSAAGGNGSPGLIIITPLY